MNLEHLIKKMRMASFTTMVSFLILTVSVLLILVGFIIMSVSLRFAVIVFGVFLVMMVMFFVTYMPSKKLNDQYGRLFEKGTPKFLFDKETSEQLEEPFVTTRPSMNGIVYINKDHKPLHSQFIEKVLEDKVLLYPKGAFKKDDICKVISSTAALTLVLYKSTKILVETKAIYIE